MRSTKVYVFLIIMKCFNIYRLLSIKDKKTNFPSSTGVPSVEGNYSVLQYSHICRSTGTNKKEFTQRVVSCLVIKDGASTPGDWV